MISKGNRFLATVGGIHGLERAPVVAGGMISKDNRFLVILNRIQSHQSLIRTSPVVSEM